MTKFIGEMTKEEFKEALKVILAKDEQEEKKNSFFADLKKDFLWCVDFIKKILTLEFLKSDKKEPLTKEVFIKKGKKVKAIIKEIIETVVFVIIAVIFIRFFIGEIRWIPTPSMKPTLIEGDRIFVERMSRFKSTPNRGDIMVFYPPETILKNDPLSLFRRLTGFFCNDIAYIKRVIAVPGDKLEIVQNKDDSFDVLINDIPLKERYIMDRFEYPVCTQNMMCGPVVMGKDEYFMMGDNRGHSADSRYWGTITKDRFIGKAIFVGRLANLDRIYR